MKQAPANSIHMNNLLSPTQKLHIFEVGGGEGKNLLTRSLSFSRASIYITGFRLSNCSACRSASRFHCQFAHLSSTTS